MEGRWGLFKRCKRCGCKLTPTDGHELCLGEGHHTDLHTHFQGFSGHTASTSCPTPMVSMSVPTGLTPIVASPSALSTPGSASKSPHLPEGSSTSPAEKKHKSDSKEPKSHKRSKAPKKLKHSAFLSKQATAQSTPATPPILVVHSLAH